jgi:hypothetical protein
MFWWGSTYNNFSQIRILSCDYIFPICYPDYNLAGFIFLKRFVGNFYFENTSAKLRYPLDTNVPKTNYSTSGAEITADFHIFYLPSPYILKIGARYAYRIESSNWAIEPIFNFAYYF